MAKPRLKLLDGERIIAVAHRHWIVLVPMALALGFALVSGALRKGILAATLPSGFLPSETTILAIAGLVVLGTAWKSRQAIEDYFTSSATLTNKRLVRRSGWLDRSISDVPLRDLDVSSSETVLGRQFG